MPYALFLGCTIPARARGYELSARAVASALEIEFADIESFTCCGFPMRNIDQGTTRMMALLNLSIAEENNVDICTLCSACCATLTETNKRVREDENLLQNSNLILGELGRNYRGKVKVKHFAAMLYQEIGLEAIRKSIKKELSMLRCAAHPGCHYLKPSEVYADFDNPEDPHTLCELIEATGAANIPYDSKTDCCGGSVLSIDENTALAMAEGKLTELREKEVDALITICPFCTVMYDGNQKKIMELFKKVLGVPILYYPQLLGLALGLDLKDLGLNMNLIKPANILEKV